MGFGKTVLVLAAGYNALIAAVKFVLAPAALYQANQEQTFDASVGDPNSLWFYLAVSSAVLLLYLLVFRVMYGLFKRRFRRRQSGCRRSAGAEKLVGRAGDVLSWSPSWLRPWRSSPASSG